MTATSASTPDDPAAGDRRAEILEQLIAMRRDAAATEDDDDFGWAQDIRTRILDTRVRAEPPSRLSDQPG